MSAKHFVLIYQVDVSQDNAAFPHTSGDQERAISERTKVATLLVWLKTSLVIIFLRVIHSKISVSRQDRV